jgi:hypothetical protein
MVTKARSSPSNNNGAKVLSIRSELFDHAVFPVPTNKITQSVLVTTFTNLNLLSSIDYKIKMNHWLEQSKRHIPGMTENDATIYFLAYKALLEEVDAVSFSGSTAANRDAPIQDLQVDVRCFAIFIALQLFSQQAAENQTTTLLSQDSWGAKEPSNSIATSPRQKSVSKPANKFSIILHFIKNNLKLLLRLVSTDIHNTEVSLTANEFNSLRVLFKT